MPWQPVEGIYVREDPDFTGPTIWQQNQQAGYKIIDTRHDDHDQDIADGISATLNIDGYNEMRANIRMGGFQLSGLGAPGSITDAALYGNTLGTAAFDNATRELTLTARDGSALPPVIIPAAAAGGDGTVTEITAGAGLVASPASITTTGSLSLATLYPAPQIFNSVVNRIDLDVYGRVTAVETTTIDPGNTNLSNTPGSSTVRINSSTGTNTTVNGATTSLAGVMTAADKSKLNAYASTPAANPVDLQMTRNDSSVTVAHSGAGGGDDAVIPMWDPAANNAGVFSGDVRASAPTTTEGKPSGYVWMVF